MADITVRPATAREKLNGKENYKTWSARMKSDLQGQALWRYTDAESLRAPPVKREAALGAAGAPAVAAESDDDYEDRVDRYDAKVHKSRTYILDNCDSWIADQCAEAYDTAAALWTHLNDQYGKQGMSQEYSTYLEWAQLQYDGRDLERFCERYRSKLLKLNKIDDFKVSEKHSLFCFLSLIGEYFPQFTANMRQDMRKTEAGGGTAKAMTLTQCITDLLDENTAQTNEGTSSAALVAARKANNTPNPTRAVPTRVDARAQLKCTHCGKTRHVEAECHTKYPEKKAAFEKMLADKKELKKQQALLKSAPKTFVANTTTTPLPPSAQYDFTTGARMLMATTISPTRRQASLPPSAEYTFGANVHAHVTGSDSD